MAPSGNKKKNRIDPTDEDTANVMRLVLSGLAIEAEPVDIADRLGIFHPRHWTYPGDVLLELAADAIAHSGATRSNPLEFGDIRERFMPELNVSSKNDHYKSKWPIRAAAMIHAGVDPGLDEEVAHWHQDDVWQWALDAVIVYVRAAAGHRGVDAADVARALARARDLVLLEATIWNDGLRLLPTWWTVPDDSS